MIQSDQLIVFRVTCDGCHKKTQVLPGVYVADSHTALRKDATRAGWSSVVRDGAVHDLCPLCSVGS